MRQKAYLVWMLGCVAASSAAFATAPMDLPRHVAYDVLDVSSMQARMQALMQEVALVYRQMVLAQKQFAQALGLARIDQSMEHATRMTTRSTLSAREVEQLTDVIEKNNKAFIDKLQSIEHCTFAERSALKAALQFYRLSAQQTQWVTERAGLIGRELTRAIGSQDMLRLSRDASETLRIVPHLVRMSMNTQASAPSYEGLCQALGVKE